MSRFSFGGAGNTPPVVRNLVIINIVAFVIYWIVGQMGLANLNGSLGIYYIGSPFFRPWQFVTYMFMHGGFTHILFNMYALWIFGKTLESVWGSKRFLIFFLVTGIGAALIQQLVLHIEIAPTLNAVKEQYHFDKITPERLIALQSSYPNLVRALVSPTVGASGAVFGILLAFGMLFPNTPLFLFFVPIPIKAKYFVIGYGFLELYLGITQPGSNIAHFAHLGGMIFGYILIKYWSKSRSNFY